MAIKWRFWKKQIEKYKKTISNCQMKDYHLTVFNRLMIKKIQGIMEILKIIIMK